MEHLPVEVIGNILSHIAAARDVVIASATCRKWREAFRKHLESQFFGVHGSSPLENVITLELGWTEIDDLFADWVAILVKICPNLKKLVIHGLISDIKTHEESQMLANFTSAMVKLMRIYMHVDVHFDYI